MRITLLICAFFYTSLGMAADYAREKRWADEITPGLVIGNPIYLQTAKGHKFLNLYTEAPNAKAAVIVVHGRGIHPDWGLIGVLRTRLAEHGYTTLSIQMPVLSAEAAGDIYLPTFPEARERIGAAVKFLQGNGYGVTKKIAIVSHSMGSRMSSDYLKNNRTAPLFAWVSISITNDTLGSIGVLPFPVLDLYGENDLPQVLNNNKARAQALKKIKGSVQIMAPKADHFFIDYDDALVEYVKGFLDKSLHSK